MRQKFVPILIIVKLKRILALKNPAKAKGNKHTKLSVYRKVRDEIKVYVNIF